MMFALAILCVIALFCIRVLNKRVESIEQVNAVLLKRIDRLEKREERRERERIDAAVEGHR